MAAPEETTTGLDMVKLIAEDGTEFFVDRKAAMVSGTIKSMLAGPGHFMEASQGEARFPSISSATMEKVIQYFYYKVKYTNVTTAYPEFPIEPDIALELLMAANYLDA